MAGCGCEDALKRETERRVLIILLGINAAMFCIEIVAGWLSESTALLADALDMFADAAVYGIALYVVGRSARAKARAARGAGIAELALALGIFFEIARRLLFGSEPESLFMIGIGALALVANTGCLLLLNRHRHGEVHLRASWIFSKNDVIANLGVIGAGLLVLASGSAWPDYVIGTVIGAVVLQGAVQILRESRAALRDAATTAEPRG